MGKIQQACEPETHAEFMYLRVLSDLCGFHLAGLLRRERRSLRGFHVSALTFHPFRSGTIKVPVLHRLVGSRWLLHRSHHVHLLAWTNVRRIRRPHSIRQNHQHRSGLVRANPEHRVAHLPEHWNHQLNRFAQVGTLVGRVQDCGSRGSSVVLGRFAVLDGAAVCARPLVGQKIALPRIRLHRSLVSRPAPPSAVRSPAPESHPAERDQHNHHRPKP